MAIAHAQDLSKGPAAGTSLTVHLASNTTATNTLVGAFCLPANASVVSVTDSTNNRWIQVGYSTSSGGCAEIWQARGIQGGSASVFATFSTTGAAVNVSEWSGIAYQSPLDQWSQNTATSASVTAQTLTPRTTGELIVVAGSSSDITGGPPSGWTAFSGPGGVGSAAAYRILSGSVAPLMYWPATANPWACVATSFLPANSTTVGATTGPTGVNPQLQFPETLVQICEAQNYLAPFQGIGIWTDVSSYVESFTIGPMGRQHELDRVQATSGSFVMNGRDGTFNPWNTGSFLYPGGLDPMTPIRCVASWDGVTSNVGYLYAQSFDPNIIDSQNVTVTISAYDILQELSLSYLASNSYAQAVLAGN